jgi:hypothetical protein
MKMNQRDSILCVTRRKQDWHQKFFYMATLSLQKIAKMRTLKTQTRTLIDVILPRGSITRERKQRRRPSEFIKVCCDKKINLLPTTSHRIKDTPTSTSQK